MHHKDAIDAAIAQVLEDGAYIMGPQVQLLEERLAAYVGRKHCVTCSNGTDALTLPLMAEGIGPGDAVFTTAFTFFATAEVIALAGATPVFVDIDPDTYNIDCQKLQEAVEKIAAEGKCKPKAVIPVDLFGLPCDFDGVDAVARKFNLLVIEDGAQGFGGSYHGRRVGSLGAYSTTSFFPAKPLGCYGDGGAVFTDDDTKAQLLRSLRVHGKGADKYDNVRIGLNARLDTIQAAILHCKLDLFPGELDARDAAAARYTEHLAGLVKTPVVPTGWTSSWAQYTVLLPADTDRAAVMERMKQDGIPTMIYYGNPMHLQKAFASLGYHEGGFPETEKACKRVLSLPMHPYITTEEIDAVCESLANALHSLD